MGTAHVCTRAVRLPICVRGGNTLKVVPPWTRTGGWVDSVNADMGGARVRVRIFLCYPFSYHVFCLLMTGIPLVTESFHCNVIVWELPDITGGEITGYTVRIYNEVNGERTNDSTVTYEISNSKTNWLAPAALPVDRPLFYQVSSNIHSLNSLPTIRNS